MPRQAREKCNSGIYHVIFRGINRQSIFHDEDDYQRFLETLDRVKKRGEIEVLGYCLMGNHVHLLLSEQQGEIPIVMKRIGVSYARWYNWKYERVGHIFQDRYKSEAVEDERYLISVLRYIHTNPVKAQIVTEINDYKWSSCKAYAGEIEYPQGLTETTFILSILSENEISGRRIYKELMKQENDDQFLDIEIKTKISDTNLYEEIQRMLDGQAITTLHAMEKKKRNEILRYLKELDGVTQRQIARVTGINQSTVFKA